MIQLLRATTTTANSFNLNIYDKMTNADYRSLLTFTSQASGNSFTSMPFSSSYTKKERYVSFIFYASTGLAPTLGFVTFGNTDLPYGFYDVTIYQNSSNANIDPTGLTVIWEGLANLKQSGNPAVEYTNYDTNDADTESVYITF
jgi:hypothetical protein